MANDAVLAAPETAYSGRVADGDVADRVGRGGDERETWAWFVAAFDNLQLERDNG